MNMNPIYCRVPLVELEGKELPWYTGVVKIGPDLRVTLACLPLLLPLRLWQWVLYWMVTPVEVELMDDAFNRGYKAGYDAGRNETKKDIDSHVRATLQNLDEIYKIKH